MIRIEEMRLIRSRTPQFLADLDGVLRDLSVAAGHRTAVTCLAFAEVFARAAPIRPEEMKTAEFYRTNILPQVQNLCDSIVEVVTVDADMIMKATFAAYEYRCGQAFPDYQTDRPCADAYAKRFEVKIEEVVKAYPDLPRNFWIIQDLFRNSQDLGR